MIALWVNQAASLSGTQMVVLFALGIIVIVGIVIVGKGNTNVQS